MNQMQEQPDNNDPDAPLDEEVPLSSEAPDTVQPAAPDLLGAPEGDLPEDVDLPQTPDAIPPDADAVEATHGPAEAPDGQVPDEPDDLFADSNAIDPKIDAALLEAYLFSTHSPLTPGRLAELFNLESTKPIRKALRVLNEQYEATGRCFRVEQVAGGFQLLTVPEFGEHLKALQQREADAKLTKAALETLAIIAYKQPILRADLEAIRGVASGEMIRSLMEKHLVKIAGRAEEPGRPILYGTTKRFLEVFGLNTLKDLPQPDSLQAKARQLAQAAQKRLADPDSEFLDAPAPPAPSAPEPEPSPETPPAEGAPGDANSAAQ